MWCDVVCYKAMENKEVSRIKTYFYMPLATPMKVNIPRRSIAWLHSSLMCSPMAPFPCQHQQLSCKGAMMCHGSIPVTGSLVSNRGNSHPKLHRPTCIFRNHVLDFFGKTPTLRNTHLGLSGAKSTGKSIHFHHIFRHKHPMMLRSLVTGIILQQ